MALSIKSDEADKLARELVALTGETLTTAVTVALRERVERIRREQIDLDEALKEIHELLASAPRLDCRTPDEIVGYDELGLPA